MENYTKGEVKEVEESEVFTLSKKDVHMRVAAGSKIRNLMGFAMKKIKEPGTRQMCWSGSGKAVTKTITCAEIMKRKIKGLHQITKIRTRRIEEYWEPKLEGLERLKVNRDIPAISILLSKDPLDINEPGYQAPGSFDEFWTKLTLKDKAKYSENARQGKSHTGNDRDGARKKTENRYQRKRRLQNEKNQEQSSNKQNNDIDDDKSGKHSKATKEISNFTQSSKDSSIKQSDSVGKKT